MKTSRFSEDGMDASQIITKCFECLTIFREG